MSHSIRPYLASIAILPLAACAGVSEYERTAVTPSLAAWTDAAVATGDAATLDQWWLTFNDAQLTALVEQALVASPDARTAVAALDEARAARRSALYLFDPRGNLSANASRQETSILSGASSQVTDGITDVASAAFDVSWELDLFGRRAVAAKSANAELTSAAFRHEAARQAIAAAVADTLFATRALALQLEDARETRDIQKRILSIIEARLAAGIAAPTDVIRIESDVIQSEAEFDRLDAELKASKRSLLVLVGRGDAPVDSLQIEAALASPPPVPELLPTQLLARRPDVQEAEARLASAAGAWQLAKRALFPSFTLRPGAGVSKTDTSMISVSTGFWDLGVGISVPVLDLPRLMAETDARSARARQAAIAYEATAVNAIAEADQSLVRLGSDIRRERLLTRAEAQARKLFEAKEALYRAGVEDLQDFLDAERTWRAARINLTGARRDALRRTVSTFKALGGGWSPAAMSASLGGIQS